MRNLLHDETDALEGIQERWRKALEEIKQQFAAMVNDARDFRDALEAVNVAAADAVAQLTTEAAQTGFDFGKRKVEVGKGEGIGPQKEEGEVAEIPSGEEDL